MVEQVVTPDVVSLSAVTRIPSEFRFLRQALHLLYSICQPKNRLEIVDELLEILSDSDPAVQVAFFK